jgi:DHA2 family multidrug resistance protein
MTQAHQANLVGSMTPYDPVFQQRVSQLTAAMGQHTAGPEARMQAYGFLNGILLQQSNLKAYVDMFCWTALVMALCLPAVWLMRRVVTKGSLSLH